MSFAAPCERSQPGRARTQTLVVELRRQTFRVKSAISRELSRRAQSPGIQACATPPKPIPAPTCISSGRNNAERSLGNHLFAIWGGGTRSAAFPLMFLLGNQTFDQELSVCPTISLEGGRHRRGSETRQLPPPFPRYCRPCVGPRSCFPRWPM